MTNLIHLEDGFGGTQIRLWVTTLPGRPGIYCVSQNIYQGGLGFRKSKKFNDAFLEKLAWKVISKRGSICIQALRSKYKVHDDWLKAHRIQNASPTWKAIER